MAKVENLHLPADRYYDPEEHLWAKVENGRVRVGIDELGRSAAGTISYVDLHKPGKRLARRGAAFGTLEADKFVGALRTPVRGTIVEINERLLESARLANEDPYGAGWFAVVEPSDLEEDLGALVFGEEAIVGYVEQKVREYRDRGILPDGSADVAVTTTH